VINANVVAIKVDREEHPEVDSVYMAQASAFAKNLGWPLTVFATPEGHTFYAATYLPPTPSDGQASLPEVIHAVSLAWSQQRETVVESASSVAQALDQAQQAFQTSSQQVLPTKQHLATVVEGIMSLEDQEYGGLGGSPKFPMAPLLRFLQGHGDGGNSTAKELSDRLLETYRHSALLDTVEGGFFRYSTLRDFSEPHYERMLGDNALLLGLYANSSLTDTAEGIVNFFERQLRVGGALGSAQDSESVIDGVRVEGAYYQHDAEARALLSPPEVDTKIITGLNGLAIEALALAHRAGVAGDPGQLGTEICWWLMENHINENGTLVRVSDHDRISSAPATAEDYGGFALGLVEMGMATGNVDFVKTARDLLDVVIDQGLEFTRDPVLEAQGNQAIAGLQEGSTLSGEALLALAALRVGALTGSPHYREFAQAMVAPHASDAIANPLGYGGILRVLSELASPRREVIVIAEGASELVGTMKRWRSEGAISVVLNSEQAAAFAAAGFSLFEGRVDGSTPTAYVCEAGVCRLPVTTATELRELLGQ
jgi:uncharacterized protein YyaL (SSP411 family)